jgi:hypothetical protein
MLSLRTNLSFERKGSSYKFDYTDDFGQFVKEVKVNYIIDYLTLPILCRATFGKKVKFFINTGPYFGFLLQEYYTSSDPNIGVLIMDDQIFMKRFDAGITTGIGLIIPVRKKFALSLEARNNMGLYNISAFPVYHEGSILTNSTNLLFGFTYRFGFRPE